MGFRKFKFQKTFVGKKINPKHCLVIARWLDRSIAQGMNRSVDPSVRPSVHPPAHPSARLYTVKHRTQIVQFHWIARSVGPVSPRNCMILNTCEPEMIWKAEKFIRQHI